MKLRNIALYLTLLLAVTASPLFAQSAASSGTAGGKATQTSKPMSSATTPSQKIDINSATKDELETHPESPAATVDSSFGGPNGGLEDQQKVEKNS